MCLRRLLLAAGAMLSACAEPEPLFVALPELPPAIGFILTFDRLDGPPVSMTSAFDLEAGPVSATGLAAKSGQTLVLLVIDDERLRATGVARRLAPSSEHQLELTEESCPSGRLDRSLDEPRLRIAVATVGAAHAAIVGASHFEPVDLRSIRSLSSAAFSLPVQAGGCPAVPKEAVSAFDPEREELLHVGAVLRGEPARPRTSIPLELALHDLDALDSDRLVGSTPEELLLFVRGEAFLDDPRRRLTPSEVPGLIRERPGETEDWRWHTTSFVPAQVPRRGSLIASAVAEVTVSEERIGFRSALVEIVVDEVGFQAVRTATVWPGEVVDNLVDPDGRIFALWNASRAERGSDRDGLILRGASLEGPWQSFLVSSQISGRSLRETGDPAKPHLLGLSVGRMLVGDLRPTPPALTLVQTDIAGDLDAVAIRQNVGGFTAWSGTNRGHISRVSSPELGVTRVDFRLPLEAFACGGSVDPCGWAVGTDRVLSLAYLPEQRRLAASFKSCEAVILFREDDLCPSALSFPGNESIGDDPAARYLSPTERGLLFFDIATRTAEILTR